MKDLPFFLLLFGPSWRSDHKEALDSITGGETKRDLRLRGNWPAAAIDDVVQGIRKSSNQTPSLSRPPVDLEPEQGGQRSVRVPRLQLAQHRHCACAADCCAVSTVHHQASLKTTSISHRRCVASLCCRGSHAVVVAPYIRETTAGRSCGQE